MEEGRKEGRKEGREEGREGGRKKEREEGRKERRKIERKEGFLFYYLLCYFKSWFCLSINEVDVVGISWLTLFSVTDVL